MLKFVAASLLLMTSVAWGGTTLEGSKIAWQPLTLNIQGPEASITDNAPNPFLDLRLQVKFTGPSGQSYNVPGYFDGDGKSGPKGNIWRTRFSPDAAGKWNYDAQFRSGPKVAIDTTPEAGTAVDVPGLKGEFTIAPRDPNAPGYLKWGRLEYADKHYLKFKEGPYWIRGGTDEPEDFLGYTGFVNTPPKHTYSAHVEDWREGDPDWDNGQGRGIIGALNYLAREHVNSIYFLTMNIGGDGKDVWPWLGPINPRGDTKNENLHFDIAKLAQWETVFAHAQRQGIFLHVVFNEAELENKRELDDGELGTERKLYYREMISRFGHHLAMQWNLCEEYNLNLDFGPDRIRAFADYLLAVDPYHHPITVHTAGDPVEKLRFTYGDKRFSMTSIQLNQRPIHQVTEDIWRETEKAGRPLPVSLDEFTLDRGQRASHIPVDDAEGHRKEKIWPTYLSGGNIEFIHDELLRTDNFKTPQRDKLWKYLWHARRFMEENLPYWDMAPADQLIQGAATIPLGVGKKKIIPLGPQVFAKRGEVYAAYLPTAKTTGNIDLTDLVGIAELKWYNPRTGQFVGPTIKIAGGGARPLGAPPADPDLDWVVLVRREKAVAASSLDTSGFLDSGSHWRHIRNDTHVIQPLPKQPSYNPSQVEEIVANILLFQRSNGGWPKDYDMVAILTDEQKQKVRDSHNASDTSFDNHNVHSQVEYLARAYTLSQNPVWKAACERGLDFMFSAQLPNGGFPQRYPHPSGYGAHITFNDGVMIGILSVLKDIADNVPHWNWLDAARREKASLAIDKGVACILKCQITVDGKLTGWCQQHDEQTYAPANARTFELASLCPQDSTNICRFLMRLKNPSPEIITAVDSAVQWMKTAKLTGLRLQRIKAEKTNYERHTANFDLVVEQATDAPSIWARHYEIGTNRPIFADRTGVKKYALADIDRERRTGTAWYGEWPQSLIEHDYPAWHKSLQNRASVSAP